MLNQIFAITTKELKVISHDRGTVVGLFLLPIAFILIMTVALQGLFDSGSSNNPVQVLIVNQDQGKIASSVLTDLRAVSGLELIEQKDGQAFIRSSAEELIVERQYALALVFPPDFSSQILSAATQPDAAGSTVTFVADPTLGSQMLSPVRGMVQGYIEREASLAQAPLRTQAGFDQMAAKAPASQAAAIQAIGSAFTSQETGGLDSAALNPGVSYAVVSPAKYQKVQQPSSAQQNVPGYTIYGVFFIIQTIATSLFREKNDGTFRRLQAAPLSRAALLTGKLLPYYLVNLIQIALMFTVGVVVFHMSLGNDPLALVLLALATGAASTGLGLLLASLTKTQEQAGSMGALLAVVLSAVGGSMVPVSIMPQFMQALSKFTPHSWALSGFQDVIVRGLGVSAILPNVGILLVFAAAFWGIAIWKFRFE